MSENIEHCEQENMLVYRTIDEDGNIHYMIECAECGERVVEVREHDE